jgi:hypothetical protein
MGTNLTLHDTIGELLKVKDVWETLPIAERRQTIEDFQSRVMVLEAKAPHNTDEGIVNHFGHGTYGREANVPAGVVMVGSIYKAPQINVLVKGVVFVATENKIAIMEAPLIFTSEANTKKVGYVIEDMQWITVMSRDNTDIDPEWILKMHTTETYGG